MTYAVVVIVIINMESKAVKKLRNGKSDGSTLQMSDQFIYGTEKLNLC